MKSAVVMKRAAMVAAALVGVCSVVVLRIPVSADTTITEVGWWTENPAASAPAGGFAIQGAPDGRIISLAAMRVLVTPEPILRAALVLNEVGGLSNENAALQVCTTGDAWQAVAKGTRASAPSPNCAGAVAFTRSNNTGTWSADITKFVVGAGEVSLMVVPQAATSAPAPTVVPPPAPAVPPGVPPPVPEPPVAGIPANLEIQFGPPSLAVELVFEEETDDTDFSDISTPGGGTFFVPSEPIGPAFDDSFDSFGASSPGSFDRSIAASDPAGLAAETAVPGQGQVIAPSSPARFRTDTAPRDIPWMRILLFIGVSAVVGALSGAARFRVLARTA